MVNSATFCKTVNEDEEEKSSLFHIYYYCCNENASEYSDLMTNYQSESYFALICTRLQFSTQLSAVDLLYFARINIMKEKGRKAMEKKRSNQSCEAPLI